MPMDMDVTDLYRELENFYRLPPGKMSRRKLEKLYDGLMDILLEYKEQLEDEVFEFLKEAIATLDSEMERQDKELKNLSAQLIKDPAEVERILGQMNCAELLKAEQKGQRLRSPALRKEVANMIRRCWPSDCAGFC